jgi:hypothetical protein
MIRAWRDRNQWVDMALRPPKGTSTIESYMFVFVLNLSFGDGLVLAEAGPAKKLLLADLISSANLLIRVRPCYR